MRISFRRPKAPPHRAPAPAAAKPASKPPCERCRKIREAAKRALGIC